MSYTQIYVVTPESCELIGETQNAWIGAMYVWNQISVDRFGLSSFPMFDDEMRMKVWNAEKHTDSITDAEIVVLKSTMDNVTVDSKDVERLLKAFDEYGQQHPNSSIDEQAAIIRAHGFKEGQKLAWCQTTVSGFSFEPEYNDEDEEVFNDLSEAWDLFKHIDAIKSKGEEK